MSIAQTNTLSSISPDQRFTDRQLAEILGIGRSSVWALVKKGELPPPECWGRSRRWRYGDVVASRRSAP
jgi:predicted DNA-binding transcriptional regulator AlpA